MSIIKGFYKIDAFLTENKKQELENYAVQYAKFWRVYFKIITIDVEEKVLVAETKQDKKTTNTPYFTKKELIEKSKEFFSPYFAEYTIRIDARVYKEPITAIVSADWMKRQMFKYRIKSKVLVEELGLSKSEISLYLSGKNPLGGRSNAMFYYYFRCKELETTQPNN